MDDELSSLDAEALFERARTLVDDARTASSWDQTDWERARKLFEEAVRQAGPEMLARVADAYAEHSAADARYWMRQAAASESEPGGITVDPDVLPIHEDRGSQDWEIAVESDDRNGTIAALKASASRLSFSLEDGTSLPPDDEGVAIIEDTDLYSPNYVAVDESVPNVWMDCKGGTIPLLARTAIRIVADELRKAGVQRARLYTPARPFTDDL